MGVAAAASTTAGRHPSPTASLPAAAAPGSGGQGVAVADLADDPADPDGPSAGAGTVTPPPGVDIAPVAAGERTVTVPILMYHYVRVNPVRRDRLGFNLSVRPDDFVTQLDLLQRGGFETVSMGQVIDAMDGHATLPAHPVVLTFDDGYADFFSTVVPLLRAHGFTATDYVVSGFLGRPNYMTAAQVASLPGLSMTVGAHTVHHIDLAIAPPALARQEIADSRAALQALTGEAVTDFAYPSGRFNAAVARMVEAAGFRDAVTTIDGVVHSPASRYATTRVRVNGGENLVAFAQSLGFASGALPVQLAAVLPGGGAAPSPAPGDPRHCRGRGHFVTY